MTTITLPWPPSVNRYWRHPSTGRLAGRHLISSDGRKYREQVAAMTMLQTNAHYAGSLIVDITANRPDNRRRDLDNLLKAILDSLTHAGIWGDDSQIIDLRIKWGEKVVPDGSVEIYISGDICHHHAKETTRHEGECHPVDCRGLKTQK